LLDNIAFCLTNDATSRFRTAVAEFKHAQLPRAKLCTAGYYPQNLGQNGTNNKTARKKNIFSVLVLLL